MSRSGALALLVSIVDLVGSVSCVRPFTGASRRLLACFFCVLRATALFVPDLTLGVRHLYSLCTPLFGPLL